MSPARNEMGNKFGGNNHRDSKGSHHGNPSKLDLRHGVVQQQGDEILEVHIFAHGGDCSEGLPVGDRPTLGKNSKPMVGVFDRWFIPRGAKNKSMENHPSDFSNSNAI